MMIKLKKKLVSPACFGVVFICFFLPFVNVKCNDVKLVTATGMNLVSGKEITVNTELLRGNDAEINDNAALQSNQSLDRNYFAIAGLGFAICGLVLSFLLLIQQEMMLGIAGIGGVLALLLMRIQIDNSIQNKTSGMSKYVVHVEYGYGYWLAVLFFLMAGLFNILRYMEQVKRQLQNDKRVTD